MSSETAGPPCECCSAYGAEYPRSDNGSNTKGSKVSGSEVLFKLQAFANIISVFENMGNGLSAEIFAAAQEYLIWRKNRKYFESKKDSV